MKAFAPANISCIFRLYENEKPEKKGSLGVGITLHKGVIVKVKKGKRTKIIVDGKSRRFSTVRSVIKKLTGEKIIVDIKSQVEFSAGFGMSGASALATAYAVNKLLGIEKSKKELATIAHTAEVEHSTGRGDVAGQFRGGILVKKAKGKPLEVNKLDVKADKIFYRVFSRLKTKDVIDSKAKVKRINKAGDKALRKIKGKIGFAKLMDISKEFAIESGLLRDKKVKKTIEEIEKKGGKASMVMLGNAVFSNIRFEGCKEARITRRGARLI